MSSFSAFTPSSTLALTANGTDAPASESGSVAGPLALTPIRHMNLTPAGIATPGSHGHTVAISCVWCYKHVCPQLVHLFVILMSYVVTALMV